MITIKNLNFGKILDLQNNSRPEHHHWNIPVEDEKAVWEKNIAHIFLAAICSYGRQKCHISSIQLEQRPRVQVIGPYLNFQCSLWNRVLAVRVVSVRPSEQKMNIGKNSLTEEVTESDRLIKKYIYSYILGFFNKKQYLL